jgi:hypothetical protein
MNRPLIRGVKPEISGCFIVHLGDLPGGELLSEWRLIYLSRLLLAPLGLPKLSRAAISLIESVVSRHGPRVRASVARNHRSLSPLAASNTSDFSVIRCFPTTPIRFGELSARPLASRAGQGEASHLSSSAAFGRPTAPPKHRPFPSSVVWSPSPRSRVVPSAALCRKLSLLWRELSLSPPLETGLQSFCSRICSGPAGLEPIPFFDILIASVTHRCISTQTGWNSGPAAPVGANRAERVRAPKVPRTRLRSLCRLPLLPPVVPFPPPKH